MKHEFLLPDIGEGLEEAEIITWLVAVGEHVERDQPLVEIMTDKSNAELPAPAAGTLVQLGGDVGDILTVGALIAVIDAATDQTDSPTEAPQAAPPTADDVVEVVTTRRPEMAPRGASDAAEVVTTRRPENTPLPADDVAEVPRPKAAPSTRRAAADRGIDLAQVAGTGPGGRILLSDLDQAGPESATPPELPVADTPSEPPTLHAMEHSDSPDLAIHPTSEHPTIDPEVEVPQPAAPVLAATVSAEPIPPEPEPLPAATSAPLRGVRRAVARNMTQSWTDIPHIHAFDHIDAEPLLALRNRLRGTERPAYESLSPLSFFVAAVAQAVRDHHDANASIDMENETITYHPNVNVGIAVAAPQGLVVPVLRGAELLDFETLSLTLSQLIRGARDGSLSRQHFLGGTVTITNFGSLGGEQATPLIRPPESLIVGFGSIKKRPFVVADAVVARQTMHMVAGADHRLLDGDVTTSVLTTVADLLTDPLQLVL